jgi:hypothetical protein
MVHSVFRWWATVGIASLGVGSEAMSQTRAPPNPRSAQLEVPWAPRSFIYFYLFFKKREKRAGRPPEGSNLIVNPQVLQAHPLLMPPGARPHMAAMWLHRKPHSWQKPPEEDGCGQRRNQTPPFVAVQHIAVLHIVLAAQPEPHLQFPLPPSFSPRNAFQASSTQSLSKNATMIRQMERTSWPSGVQRHGRAQSGPILTLECPSPGQY